MKMLLCTDVRLGAMCNENLDITLSHKWQTARIEKFSELIDMAAQNNAAYVALFGRLFGQERFYQVCSFFFVCHRFTFIQKTEIPARRSRIPAARRLSRSRLLTRKARRSRRPLTSRCAPSTTRRRFPVVESRAERSLHLKKT